MKSQCFWLFFSLLAFTPMSNSMHAGKVATLLRRGFPLITVGAVPGFSGYFYTHYAASKEKRKLSDQAHEKCEFEWLEFITYSQVTSKPSAEFKKREQDAHKRYLECREHYLKTARIQ